MRKKAKLLVGDARWRRCCFEAVVSPNMEQLVTRECIRVLSIHAGVTRPIRDSAELLCVHCVDNSLSCPFLREAEVCFRPYEAEVMSCKV